MNINDYANPTEMAVDKLQAIMDRQKELMHKYHDIELASGLMQATNCPVDLHSKFGQARLKDFSWRITEELMEALEAYRAGDKDHFEEELIDALHFMMEQHILIGFDSQAYKAFIISPLHYVVRGGPLEYYFSNCEDGIRGFDCDSASDQQSILAGIVAVVESLGLAMNCLKNKPWKQTHMLTDVGRFTNLTAQSFFDYIRLLKLIGITPDDVYNLYFRKSEVNAFRQRSKY